MGPRNKTLVIIHSFIHLTTTCGCHFESWATKRINFSSCQPRPEQTPSLVGRGHLEKIFRGCVPGLGWPDQSF